MDNYQIIENKLVIQFEPYNEVEEFAVFCHKLLETEHDDLFIYFSDKVFFINSQYVGVLMMTVAGAKMKGKVLTISCTKRLGRMLCIIGGAKLKFDLREDLIEDVNSPDFSCNDDNLPLI